MRGIAADPDRDRLYALSRVPPGLAIMETETGESGEEKQVVAFVDLCVQPSNLQLHRSESGWLLAYVVCWASGQLYVVDPRAAELVSIIPVGKGPHDIAFAPDDPWIPSYLRNKAYVSNFAENTISIIDLDVQSPTWHQVIGRIGLPEQAVKQ
jgi:DNA-binding beta-propeller fold protein YncE